MSVLRRIRRKGFGNTARAPFSRTRVRGTDGRTGTDTMLAVRDYQRKIGMAPADGYAGVGLLARLRQGS